MKGRILASLVLGTLVGCSSSDDNNGGPVDPGADSTTDVASDGTPPGDAPIDSAGGDTTLPPGDTPPPPTDTGPSTGKAAAIAKKLRGKTNFLIGMGNDLASDHSKDGAYTLGVTLDLHYTYLVGLKGSGGWPEWNTGGTFVNIMTDSADAKGVTPMFTLYQMAAWGDGNLAGLTDNAYMKPYWDGVKLMFERIAVFGKQAVVHFEPDFWGYCLQKNADPTKIPVNLKANAPDCSDLPNDMSGFGKCLVRIARKYAPTATIGFHASNFGVTPAAMANFLKGVGATDADVIVVETLDRDAGCFEAAVDPNCKRTGKFYWDETNATSPNFKEHLTWVKAVADSLALPALWWQTPFGVPSTTPGGSAGKYRDNRVKYIFEHVSEFVAAGGVGVAFGTGAGNQTYITTDGGQFKTAVTKYFAAPVALP